MNANIQQQHNDCESDEALASSSLHVKRFTSILWQRKSTVAVPAAAVWGVVRSGEWQLCELCGMLPLGSYSTEHDEEPRKTTSYHGEHIN